LNVPFDREANGASNGSANGSASGHRQPTPSDLPRRRRRLGPRLAGLALGALLGLLLPLFFLFYSRSGGQLPPLTRAMLDSARSQWQAQGIADYEMDIRIGGRRSGLVHIEVHDGQATAMTRDGVTPKRRATWDAWTVPSMFDMLETELSGAANPAKAFGAPEGSRVIERAAFDSQTGCPRAYERFVLGTSLDMSWQVAQFRVLDKSAASAPRSPAATHP
jgi:hypothetical protein